MYTAMPNKLKLKDIYLNSECHFQTFTYNVYCLNRTDIEMNTTTTTVNTGQYFILIM